MKRLAQKLSYTGGLLLLLFAMWVPVSVQAAKLSTPKIVSVESVNYKSIKLTWKAVSGAKGYYIYRKPAGGKYTKIATIKKGSTETYTDKKATTGKKFTYTVQAYSKSGSKNVVSGKSKAKSCTALPAAPTLKSLSVKSAKSVKLSWKKVSGSNGYRVYRKTGKGKWKVVKTITGAGKVSYTDSSVVPGATYSYTVSSFRKSGSKKYYGAYNKTGLTVETTLPAPDLGTASSSGGGIKITWGKVNSGSGYRIYRKSGSGRWMQIREVAGKNSVSYTDTGASAGAVYFYSVAAYVKIGSRTYVSSYDTVGITAANTLETPSLVGASAAGSKAIVVKWNSVSGASGYRVMRKLESGGSWDVLKDVGGGDTASYTDGSVDVGVPYLYTVRAYASVDGVNVYSNYNQSGVRGATSMDSPPAITSVTAEGSDKVSIKWAAVSGVNGYRVFRKMSTSSTWITCQTLEGASTTSMVDTAVVAGKSYAYNIKAYIVANGKTTWTDYGSSSGMSVTIPVGNISIEDIRGSADASVVDAFNTLGFEVVVNPNVSYSGCFSVTNHNITLQTASASVLLHEVGHFLSFVAGGADSTSEFKNIYSTEKGLYTGTNKVYVTKSSGEYFAESYRDYCEQRSTLQSQRPKTYQYIVDSLAKVTPEQVEKLKTIYGPFWAARK